MKAKIKATDKEFEVISVRVAYGDDYNDFYEDDVEIIPNNLIDWQSIRIEAATSNMPMH